MTNILPAIYLVIGAILFFCGFRVGWKASYSIRMVKGGDIEDGQALFHPGKEPAEFGLLEPKKKPDEVEKFEKL
jgi:hypothetical protein